MPSPFIQRGDLERSMQRGYVDPWAKEKMSRSEAARRYQNLIQYQLARC